jgi:hypothetical protein
MGEASELLQPDLRGRATRGATASPVGFDQRRGAQLPAAGLCTLLDENAEIC